MSVPKKNESILLRLPAPLCARLNLAAEAKGGRRYRQDIIRSAIEARLEELEARSGHVSAELAAALAQCRALGVDPISALAAAAERALGIEPLIFPKENHPERAARVEGLPFPALVNPGHQPDPRPAA